jgi:hypothetical protein
MQNPAASVASTGSGAGGAVRFIRGKYEGEIDAWGSNKTSKNFECNVQNFLDKLLIACYSFVSEA